MNRARSVEKLRSVLPRKKEELKLKILFLFILFFLNIFQTYLEGLFQGAFFCREAPSQKHLQHFVNHFKVG